MNNPEDRKDFAEKISEMCNAFGRNPRPDLIGSFFQQLIEYPLIKIIQAIDIVIKKRAEMIDKDLFSAQSLPSVPEIIYEVKKILDRKKVGCVECDGTGWILSDEGPSQATARPCKCRLKAADSNQDVGGTS